MSFKFGILHEIKFVIYFALSGYPSMKYMYKNLTIQMENTRNTRAHDMCDSRAGNAKIGPPHPLFLGRLKGWLFSHFRVPFSVPTEYKIFYFPIMELYRAE